MLAAKTFGLELSIIEQCSEAEKNRFTFLTYSFFALIVMSFISLYYLFFLLLNSYFLAFFLALMIGYVFYNILRFALISIGVPLTSDISFKNVLFSSGNIARLLIFSAFVFTACVPFTSYLFEKEINPEINKYKNQLSESYKEAKFKSKEQLLLPIINAISLKKSNIIEIKKKLKSSDQEQVQLYNFSLSKLNRQIIQLQKQFKKESQFLTKKIKKDVNRYNIELKKIELPFLRFRNVFHHPKAFMFIFLFFSFFMLIIPLYIHTLVAKKYQFAKLLQSKTKNTIEKNHQNNLKDIVNYVKKRFNVTYPTNSCYADAPFDTLLIKEPPTKIEKQHLYDYFDTISNIKSNV